MNSTFWNDGYRDAMQFNPPYPPDVNVYAVEYMDGFNRGRADRKVFPAEVRGTI